MKVPVTELLPGDLVNLQGDIFADNGEHPEFEFELQTVIEVERETPNCVRVDFESGSFGFPPDYTVDVQISPERGFSEHGVA